MQPTRRQSVGNRHGAGTGHIDQRIQLELRFHGPGCIQVGRLGGPYAPCARLLVARQQAVDPRCLIVVLVGELVTTGAVLTVRLAADEVAAGVQVPVTMQRY